MYSSTLTNSNCKGFKGFDITPKDKKQDSSSSNLELSSASICIEYSCDAAKENFIHIIYSSLCPLIIKY